MVGIGSSDTSLGRTTSLPISLAMGLLSFGVARGTAGVATSTAALARDVSGVASLTVGTDWANSSKACISRVFDCANEEIYKQTVFFSA